MGLAFVGLIFGAYTLRVNELKRREEAAEGDGAAANRGTDRGESEEPKKRRK